MTRCKRTLLLTGGSGVLGRALIDELAHDFEIVCLRNRRHIADPRVAGEFAGRVDHPTLGLSTDEYRRLAHRVDAIVHSAAVTSWKDDPAQIRDTNLSGPAVLLRLAEEARAPLYFISTAFVANPPADGNNFPGAATYVQSKIDAERLVRECPVDTVIVRPSVVSGSTVDGRIAAFQGLHRVLGGVVRGRVPLVPCDADSLIDTIPQDVVAQAIGKLLREHVSVGEFWLTAGPNALRAKDFLELCEELSSDLGIDVAPPRFLPSEAVDRLVLPLLEDALPADTQQMFRDFLEFLWMFQTPDPLPTSIPELGFERHITRAAMRTATAKSLRYWAETRGVIPPETRRVA
jgi:thioester reductase-like protein